MTERVGRRARGSIQLRITAVAAVAVLVLLAIAAAVVSSRFERQLVEQVDRELATDAAIVQRSVAEGRVGALRRSGAVVDLIVQVVRPDGTVVDGTTERDGMAALVGPDVLDSDLTTRFLTVDVDDIGPVRVVAQQLGDRPVLLVVGRSIEQVDAAAASLRRVAWIGVPTIAALVALLVWSVVGRALRPVDAVRRDVESITERDLSRRIAPPATDDEISGLVDTMNSMLDRVEHGVERELRFVADASHELRSPLAGARLLLETEPDDPEEVASSRAETLDTIARLERLVDQMLELARLDGGAAARVAGRLVDLDELVLAQAARMRRTTHLEIDTAGVSGGQIRGDDNQLGRVVENLTANATRHARTTIALAVDEDGDTVRLAVDDDGGGVPAGERARVFGRFARLDDSRVRDAGGTGLGLAIVEAIVTDHGGTIRVEDSRLGGARFVAEFPRPQVGATTAERDDPTAGDG